METATFQHISIKISVDLMEDGHVNFWFVINGWLWLGIRRYDKGEEVKILYYLLPN